MGFLNPWIYSVGYKGLTDITTGGNTGCTGADYFTGEPTPLVPYAGFNATVGWDPVTGYGTPLFDKLKDLALSNTTANCGSGVKKEKRQASWEKRREGKRFAKDRRGAGTPEETRWEGARHL